jgi:phosphoribosyl 1,2-cyclic phosphodiesterase
MPAFVNFWGTRGSIPTPASWTRVYGGNTPCVEIRFDEAVFICDAGSGIRELGKDLARRDPVPKTLHLLITHSHWDHIQGFPFFAPSYAKDTKIFIYGRKATEDTTFRVLSGQMSSQFFPVSFSELGASIVTDHLHNGCQEIEGVKVRSFEHNHPGGCLGFSFEKNGCKIVYSTDNELEIQSGDQFPDLENTGPLRNAPEPLLEIMKRADLLILDAQYDDKQYAQRQKWGHSSCFSATDLAIRAHAKNLALFHHDPESTDRAIDEIVEACRHRAARHGSPLKIFAAREGVELKF